MKLFLKAIRYQPSFFERVREVGENKGKFIDNILIIAVFCIFLQAFFVCSVEAQQPTNVRISLAIIRSFRNMENTSPADDIVKEAISRKHFHNYTSSRPFATYNYYRKTSVDFVANKDATLQRIQSNEDRGGSFYHKYVVPFEGWLDYARDIPNTDDLDLTILLYENYGTVHEDHKRNLQETRTHASRMLGFFETLGQQNVSHFLDEMFGDIDLYRNEAELMLLNFKTPLADDALKTYEYRLLGFKNINGNDCYEIAFYAKNPKSNAFAGYLYIDVSSLALHKTVFTFNNPANMNFLKDILITHSYSKNGDTMCPAKKENAIVLGDGFEGGLFIVRTSSYSNFDFEKFDKKKWKSLNDEDYRDRDSLYWRSVRPFPLTPSQTQIDELVKIAPENNIYIRLQELIAIFLSSHATVGGINGKVELGPLLQFVSYNEIEGFRLKLGGNTTTSFLEQLQIGGYLVYGTRDEQWKYRGNLIYSFFPREKCIWEYPKRLLSFTYINDLNIPGQDLLTTDRDNLIYSFSHASTNNMSRQKIGLLTFENENKHNFSYQISTKYTSDSPAGIVKYIKKSGTEATTVDRLNTAELIFSVKYSPHERFFQNRDKRIPIRRGNVELSLNHRIGLKGIFGSDYNYRITNISAYKKIVPGNIVDALDLRLSAGMVWNKVPFPLLFIPIGNQSYIYQPEDYNCMNFYEFTTDRFIAGNVDFLFNWSPIKCINKKSKIKTSMGCRTIYGPLSDKNNPELHPDLFIFNEGVTALGKTPYVEVNIGLVNIFKILKLEYAHRLTYIKEKEDIGGNKPNQGSLLITGSFAF